MMLTESERSQFFDDGYVVVDRAVEPRLMEPLREAADRITAKTRSGEWPHHRAAVEGDIWGVQQLLHPGVGEPAFLEYMASDPVLEVARDLLGPALRMGLLNMLVNPVRTSFAIGWHRDFLRQELPAEQEESTLLATIQNAVQWNTALYRDECLLIIPGTHRRAATAAEREIQFQRPMDEMPNQMVVRLEPGQGVYYNPNLIHRGIYPHDRTRATLHAALTHAGMETSSIYYDQVSWMEQPGFREALPPPLLPLHDEWLRFAEECKNGTKAGSG